MAVRKQGFELICDIKLSGERALREAQRQGRPEPTLLPDPRDINIDPYTGMWTIKGPVTSEEKNFVDSMVEFRDEQLDELKHLVGELREGIVREGAQQIVERSSMLLHKTNKALEGRYKISESEFTLLISEANRILSSKGRSPRSK